MNNHKRDAAAILQEEGPEAFRKRVDDDIVAAANGKGTISGGSQRFILEPFDNITLSTGRNYLIKGLLPREGVAVIWGPPKCGKSFWTFDAVMHIALGWEYRGRRVQQGAVVYLALEGARGFRARITAFRQRFLTKRSKSVPFFLVTEPLNLTADREELVKDVREQIGVTVPAVVVIDTLNRSLVGSESKDADMAAYLRGASYISDAFKCLVVLIHHCGHDESRLRGHSSLMGNTDAEISVKRDAADNLIVTVERVKDGPDGAVIASVLEQVEVGTDEDGDPQTSMVVTPTSVSDSTTSNIANMRGVSAGQKRFLTILQDAIASAPSEHTSPGNLDAISREWLKTCCKAKGWFDPGVSDDNSRAKVSNMINNLAGKGILGADKLFVWIEKR